MIETARRILVVAVLALWLGGFAFYTAVVLPAGHEIVTSGTRFGFVTRVVMERLQWILAAALPVLLWNLAASWKDSGRIARAGLLATWGFAAVALPLLFWFHSRISDCLDLPSASVVHPGPFRQFHNRYEFLATAAWVAGLGHLLLVVALWRRRDRQSPAA